MKKSNIVKISKISKVTYDLKLWYVYYNDD